MEEHICESPVKRKINLTLLNGTGYIFNVEDYLFIRKNYRIVGSMVGTPCNNMLGTEESSLPVELSKYETNLLVEKEIAQLLSKANHLLANENNFKSVKSEVDQTCARDGINLKEFNLSKDFDFLSKDSAFEHKNKNIPDCKLIEIHCAHPKKHFAKLIRPPAVDQFKYRVFRDLWSRGKYITGGDSFGADFLIYPGDPLQYHASHIIILLNETIIDPLDLISKVRIATVVNKHCIFAYSVPAKNGLEDELRYQTVLWEGDHNEDEYPAFQDYYIDIESEDHDDDEDVDNIDILMK